MIEAAAPSAVEAPTSPAPNAAPPAQQTNGGAFIDIVMSTRPGCHDGSQPDFLFVEVEGPDRTSKRVGEWSIRADGYHVLRITPQDIEEACK